MNELSTAQIRVVIETLEKRATLLESSHKWMLEKIARQSSPFWVKERGKVANDKIVARMENEAAEMEYKARTLREALEALRK